MAQHFQLLVIGGGNAGLSAAAHLLLKSPSTSVGIIEPSDKHYYQPAWTLVGGGAFNIKDTERNEQDFIPKGATWIKDKVASFQPENNQVTLAGGTVVGYDQLLVCPGIQLDWSAVKGLPEALGKNGVSSNYSFQHAPYTWALIKGLKKGKAIFHNPHTPVKCGGAPHKIMYLAADHWRRTGALKDMDIQYWSGGGKLFAVPRYEKTLLKVVERGGIKLNFNWKLEEIDGPNKRARFIGIGEKNKDVEQWLDYDMIHVTPPQSAPDFIKQSPLANSAGWVDVDKHSLRHNKYPNVWSIGDAAGLPTSKTGAAIRKQTPTVVTNILAAMAKKDGAARYDGYTSCPLVTGYGKLVLAEFDYDNKPQETFPIDQSKERWSMYQLKREVLPRLYWNFILRGRAQG
ncbi:MAG: NAD(P)/FAD-dependent oxidoreductase [Flavobacteriales bacterium]|nr:NAD(P)/FAD-dependent oxidoreductase [Flavobacteriales bacterium]